jgi:hypothetical protein
LPRFFAVFHSVPIHDGSIISDRESLHFQLYRGIFVAVSELSLIAVPPTFMGFQDRDRQRPIRRVGGDEPKAKKAAPAKKVAAKKAAPKKKKKAPSDDDDSDDDEKVKPPPKKKAKVASSSKKAGSSANIKFPAEFQCTSGTLFLSKPCAVPYSFRLTIRSGKLLWGQLHTVIEGHNNSANKVDSRSGPISASTGGTIMQNQFVYCCAARPGKWIANRLIMNGSQIGYVVHHEDEDPLVMAHATKDVRWGVPHTQKRVVYVNRYDWVR